MKRIPRTGGKLLTLKEAESEYGVPYARLWTWVTEQRIPRLDEAVAGRSIMIRRTDLEGFIDRHMTEAAS